MIAQKDSHPGNKRRDSQGEHKLLGVDWGAKRIGLASANSGVMLAFPLETWDNAPDVLQRLAELSEKDNVKTIVVGLPRGIEGQETAQTKQVRLFAGQLKRTVPSEVVLQDETLTTEAAAARYRGQDVDSSAATIILQDYLESL